MLIKRNDFMTSGLRPVKKMAVSLLSTLAICTAAMAPAAFAADPVLTDRTVTVKFNLSDLEAENGVEKVYKKIKKRAKSYCRADRRSVIYLEQTVTQCANDLMNQFIENADIDSLIAFHLAKNPEAPIKMAALKTN